jgi:L-ascorbate metabolism protein UlaG (beta-lactamase superfamily)
VRARRLGWAGIELEAGGESLVVDHMLDPGSILSFSLGEEERDELVAPEPGWARAALLTHLHRDHADPDAIERAVVAGGPVHRPVRRPNPSALEQAATGEAEAALRATARPVVESEPGDTHAIGAFTVTAVAASDGLGSPQVSWLIEADGQRVLHAGDTLWHGAWWEIALAHGPIEVAFLPANGVEIAYPGWEPAVGVPAVMTPHQAVEATRALGARTLAPIHYNRTFEHPDFYRPIAGAEQLIRTLAAERGVTVSFLEPGDWVEVAELAAV